MNSSFIFGWLSGTIGSIIGIIIYFKIAQLRSNMNSKKEVKKE